MVAVLFFVDIFMGDAFSSSLIFIIQTLGNFYIIICLLRVLLPLAGISYINPICQMVSKATDPGVKILRTFLPSVKGLSLAAVTWAYLAQLLLLIILYSLKGFNALGSIESMLVFSVYHLMSRLIELYFYALIVVAIASFVAPQSGHPALHLVRGLVEPLLRPIRKVLPPMGGFDFSVLIAFMLLNVIRIFLNALF